MIIRDRFNIIIPSSPEFLQSQKNKAAERFGYFICQYFPFKIIRPHSSSREWVENQLHPIQDDQRDHYENHLFIINREQWESFKETLFSLTNKPEALMQLLNTVE